MRVRREDLEADGEVWCIAGWGSHVHLMIEAEYVFERDYETITFEDVLLTGELLRNRWPNEQ